MAQQCDLSARPSYQVGLFKKPEMKLLQKIVRCNL